MPYQNITPECDASVRVAMSCDASVHVAMSCDASVRVAMSCVASVQVAMSSDASVRVAMSCDASVTWGLVGLTNLHATAEPQQRVPPNPLSNRSSGRSEDHSDLRPKDRRLQVPRIIRG